MKSIKIAGLCLVSMCVMSLAVASTASAVPIWEGCLETSTTTKYTSNSCVTAGAGKWGWAEIANTDNVRGLGLTLRLKDTATGVAVVCPDTAEPVETGTVGPGRFDRIETAEVIKPANCIRTEGLCPSLEKVEGINLPWQTSLIEENGKIFDVIEATEAGKEPGWRVRCSGVTDECKSSGGRNEKTLMTNELTKGVQLVKANFQNAAKGNCTLAESKGQKETAELTGDAAILLANAKFEASGVGLKVK